MHDDDDRPLTPGSITIARHGEPDADRTIRMDWRGYERWWAAYDEAGLKPGQNAPEDLVEQADGAVTVFSSTLPRARETAQSAAPERVLEIEAVFVEAALPPPPIPGRFKSRTWGVFARCCWWLGMARGRETRQEAEARAERAADRIVEAAANGPVILFAHGWFNRMLRPALKRRGYACVRDGGDWYWSWRRFEHRSCG
ncbi:MAG: histidine phosphatase family protein [Pseudomonadota bacterium]